MIVFMNLFKLIDIVVCIHLGSCKAAVAQKVFYSLYVCAIIKQVGGESVP